MEGESYSSQNLAGILAVALGLEAGRGRVDFSGTHRETLRRALDHPSAPQTFADLLKILEQMDASPETVSAVRSRAEEVAEHSLQGFAQDFALGGEDPPSS